MTAFAYETWVERLNALAAAVQQLEPVATAMDVPLERQRGWYGALMHKLVPMLARQPVLVVAVVGGTNTGKSTLFNHLVGSVISHTSVYATYTKHPVCVVPQGMLHTLPLSDIFTDFELVPWTSEEDAVAEGPDNRLIVREDPSGQQAARLLLLDTPDMDGVLLANWHQAEQIRNAADVLVCTVTPEKYADHAVLNFLKPAAASDTTIIVVMNKLQRAEDREHMPMWLEPLATRAGITPHLVYTVPFDRDAAEANRLSVSPYTPGAKSLREDLADLKFTAIKLRSLRGSLRVVLDREQGVQGFLQQLSSRSQAYAQDRETLQREVLTPHIELPALPPRLLWEPIHAWLGPRRTQFDRMVHGIYSQVGKWLTRPFRHSETQLEATFREQEWAAYQRAIQNILDKMRLLREVGSPRVQQAVKQALSGVQQEQLFTELRSQYDKMPIVSDDYRRYVHLELDRFSAQHPYLMRGIQYGLVATAVIRPVFTLGLFVPGAELSSYIITHAAMDSVQQAVVTAGVETAVVVTGESVAGGGSTIAIRQLLAGLARGYYQERTGYLATILNQSITGSMLEEIERFATVGEWDVLRQAQRLIAEMQADLQKM
jgi:hypothetical protein